MSSEIDWEHIFSNWKCSGYAEQIKDEILINDLIALFEYFLEDGEDKVVTMGIRPKNALSRDQITKYVVLEEAANQLKKHRRVWKTHLDELIHLFVEYPVVIQKVKHVRYFKVKIADGIKSIKNPKQIGQVSVDYHDDGTIIEVKYV